MNGSQKFMEGDSRNWSRKPRLNWRAIPRKWRSSADSWGKGAGLRMTLRFRCPSKTSRIARCFFARLEAAGIWKIRRSKRREGELVNQTSCLAKDFFWPDKSVRPTDQRGMFMPETII